LPKRDAIRHGNRSTKATISARTEVDGEINWSAGAALPGRKPKGLTESRSLNVYAAKLADDINGAPEKASLPIVVAYSVNRAVLDIPLRIRTKVPFAQYAALDDTPFSGPRNFRTFFAWFRDREDVENEQRSLGRRQKDPQLKAVRSAVEGLLDGFSDLRVRRQPLRMLITKDGQDFQVDQLSDGEKCVLALVGDLARRLAIANPANNNPLHGLGIVLIDEIELHLHPAWQRSIVGGLKRVFPNCQFIVSTHSAQVLGEVDPQGIFLLDQGRIKRPNRSFGRDSNLILQELMGASQRSKWAVEALGELYELIDEGKMKAARPRFDELEKRLGTDEPDLTAARALFTGEERAA
jgi:predicted ATP-binding protein involved in virulence